MIEEREGFKVSIITVVYNSERFLEKTIKSIVEQEYKNIEYIIVDGGSTDGTIELIKKHENNIEFWVSEKDQGIYDAMNKGLKAATGNYVWFINSGDEIYSQDTLHKLWLIHMENNADAYYGDMEYIDDNGNPLGFRTLKRPPEELSWQNMKKGMVVSHQSVIINKKFTVHYDVKYRHSADVDWMIRSLKQCKKIVNTRLVLSRFLTGGYSKKNIFRSNVERFKILRSHFDLMVVLKSHVEMGMNFAKYYFSHKKKLYFF